MIRNLRAKLDRIAQEAPAVRAEPAPAPDCRVLMDVDGALSAYRDVRGADVERLGNPQAEAWWRAEDALFLDTETTGLSGGAGTVAFLVGLGWWEADGLHVEQLLMREYSEESALLEKLLQRMEGKSALVTFNGRSFDMPLLETRLRMNRMPVRNLPNVDLLHPARRIWKNRLQSCTLSELERSVLGIERVDDLPGSEVPKRFFRFLECRDETLLDDILRHNAQDIKSMALLLHRMAQAFAQPTQERHAQDVLGIGRALERQGEWEAAEGCYRQAALSPLGVRGRAYLGELYRKQGQYEKSAQAWTAMVRAQPRVEHYVALSKVLEHRLGELGEALRVTRQAVELAQRQHRSEELVEALRRREARLCRKMTATGEKGRDTV